MRKAVCSGLVAMALAGCRQPEQPAVPPKPTDPTNVTVAQSQAVLDASIVSDAPAFDVGSFGLDAIPVGSKGHL
jgi:hypothetical protein